MTTMSPVLVQILWNRLVSIVDEAASGLIRTAYTPSVKEYHDFCCALFDADANMLAHSTVTTAGFLGIVPEVMRNFLRAIPAQSLRDGDAILTNDPWLASGHLIDITIAAPIFHRGRIVAYTLCIVHHLDMGGRMATLESKNLYEEGLKIPILKLIDAGVMNETVLSFIRANVRVSDKVLGDLRAQIVANNVCTRGLLSMLSDHDIPDLQDLAAEIITRSERSFRGKILAIPDGTYRNETVLPPAPGWSEEIRIRCAVTVAGDSITIDYAGSSGEVGIAINCTPNIVRSYTAYPFKLALDPTVPNNEGGLRPITVLAPEGSVLNARAPAPTWGRTMIAHLLPEIVFGAMEGVMPDLVLGGNGGTPANEMYLHGRTRDGRAFMTIAQHSGGFGASARNDGYSTLCFPNNTANIPIEITENEARMYYRRKELMPDSGGPGRHRGGAGQEVEFCVLDGGPPGDEDVDVSVRISGRGDAGNFPVFGRCGGGRGRGAGLWIDGTPSGHGTTRRLVPGTSMRFCLSGGGGYGDAFERDPASVQRDVADGYVSVVAAARDYGVVLAEHDLALDAAATAMLRRTARTADTQTS